MSSAGPDVNVSVNSSGGIEPGIQTVVPDLETLLAQRAAKKAAGDTTLDSTAVAIMREHPQTADGMTKVTPDESDSTARPSEDPTTGELAADLQTLLLPIAEKKEPDTASLAILPRWAVDPDATQPLGTPKSDVKPHGKDTVGADAAAMPNEGDKPQDEEMVGTTEEGALGEDKTEDGTAPSDSADETGGIDSDRFAAWFAGPINREGGEETDVSDASDSSDAATVTAGERDVVDPVEDLDAPGAPGDPYPAPPTVPLPKITGELPAQDEEHTEGISQDQLDRLFEKLPPLGSSESTDVRKLEERLKGGLEAVFPGSMYDLRENVHKFDGLTEDTKRRGELIADTADILDALGDTLPETVELNPLFGRLYAVHDTVLPRFFGYRTREDMPDDVLGLYASLSKRLIFGFGKPGGLQEEVIVDALKKLPQVQGIKSGRLKRLMKRMKPEQAARELQKAVEKEFNRPHYFIDGENGIQHSFFPPVQSDIRVNSSQPLPRTQPIPWDSSAAVGSPSQPLIPEGWTPFETGHVQAVSQIRTPPLDEIDSDSSTVKMNAVLPPGVTYGGGEVIHQPNIRTSAQELQHEDFPYPYLDAVRNEGSQQPDAAVGMSGESIDRVAGIPGSDESTVLAGRGTIGIVGGAASVTPPISLSEELMTMPILPRFVSSHHVDHTSLDVTTQALGGLGDALDTIRQKRRATTTDDVFRSIGRQQNIAALQIAHIHRETDVRSDYVPMHTIGYIQRDSNGNPENVVIERTGDAMAYLIRDGQVFPLMRDMWSEALYKAGRITAEQADELSSLVGSVHTSREMQQVMLERAQENITQQLAHATGGERQKLEETMRQLKDLTGKAEKYRNDPDKGYEMLFGPNLPDGVSKEKRKEIKRQQREAKGNLKIVLNAMPEHLRDFYRIAWYQVYPLTEYPRVLTRSVIPVNSGDTIIITEAHPLSVVAAVRNNADGDVARLSEDIRGAQQQIFDQKTKPISAAALQVA